MAPAGLQPSRGQEGARARDGCDRLLPSPAPLFPLTVVALFLIIELENVRSFSGERIGESFDKNPLVLFLGFVFLFLSPEIS